jgi:protein-S-isoprenylcysteine O-methyltransferase Ste14
MTILIALILELVFIVNILLFWWTFSRKDEYPRVQIFYKKIFPYIWTITLLSTLILNSSIFQFIFPSNCSYLQGVWLWFIMLGIVFILVGFKIISMVRKLFKLDVVSSSDSKLITTGPYSFVRHPVYLAWVLIFMGWSFILDSPLAIVFIPILILFLEIHSTYEEKHILIPKYGEAYIHYCRKVPYRMFSPPYNYAVIIIGIIVAYLGLANFFFPT